MSFGKIDHADVYKTCSQTQHSSWLSLLDEHRTIKEKNVKETREDISNDTDVEM